MKKNIYLIGKVKDTSIENRNGGWRNKLIQELFGVDISIGLNAADDVPDMIRTVKINEEFNYVGPFLYGCDHSCAHSSDYAHGVLNCTSNDFQIADKGKPNFKVLEISLEEIKRSDIVIVNFEETPLQSFGSIAEVGYANGNYKKIFGLGEHIPELWFVQGMCEMCSNVEELRKKIMLYNLENPKPAQVTLSYIIWDKNN